MRSTPRFRSAVLALPIALALGCSDGPTGPTGPLNELSPESAADAYDALSAVSGFGPDVGALRAGPGQRVVTVTGPQASLTLPINESEPCPLGGTTTVSGSATINETTFDGSVDVRQNYNSCGAASSSGREWTFDGNPSIRTRMTFNGETGAGSGTITGGFRYSSDGESGSCTISLTLTYTDVSGSVVGTVCGHPINETFEDSAGT